MKKTTDELSSLGQRITRYVHEAVREAISGEVNIHPPDEKPSDVLHQAVIALAGYSAALASTRTNEQLEKLLDKAYYEEEDREAWLPVGLVHSAQEHA
jgi:hypothetical protein